MLPAEQSIYFTARNCTQAQCMSCTLHGVWKHMVRCACLTEPSGFASFPRPDGRKMLKKVSQQRSHASWLHPWTTLHHGLPPCFVPLS